MTNEDKDIIAIIKTSSLRRDKKGRAYYGVPTTKRRNGQMIVPETKLQRWLNQGYISQTDIDNIRHY